MLEEVCMGQKCCGKNVKKNNPVDKRGNSLKKYAYLHPNQKKILDGEEQSE
jgi:hypothetical protein